MTVSESQGETNFDRLVKQVLKVQGDKVPKDQRTKQLEAVAKEQGVELPEEPKIDPFVVSNVYLEGITQVLVRANTIPLLPPISVSEVQIDPEIMKNPVGLFLWINALVLKTLERSGFHLVNAVASSAIVAGLAAKGTSQAAIKGMVTGGGMAWDCTYRGISSAAGDTIAAGRVVVSSTWTGAAEMYKYVGMGVDGASHGIGNFGMSTGDAGHKVFADTGHFLDGATQTTIGVGGKVVAGTSRVVGDAGKSTWTAGSHAVSGAGAAVEDAGKATWEATTGTLKQAGKGSWGVTTTTAAGVASGLSSVGRGITSLFGSNSKGRKPQT